jgi:hypothetical protein
MPEETKRKISESLRGDKNYKYKHICPALICILRYEINMPIRDIALFFNVGETTIRRKLREIKRP